jgi:hypothetical protein
VPALSSLTRPNIVQATIGQGDDIVTVEFDRNKVTLNWLATLSRGMATQEATVVAESLAGVIHNWDLTNDDGSPFPPTAVNIGDLPTSVLAELSFAVHKASAPGEAEGKVSPEPSPSESSVSTGPPVTSPNGQVTSESPSGSGSLSLS